MTNEEIQALRGLPPDFVREVLKEHGIELHLPYKKVKNGLDVAIYEAGWEYNEACEKMAELFPDVIRTGASIGLDSFASAIDEARRQAQTRHKPFREYGKGEFGYDFRHDLFRWWKALQLANIDIHTNISREAIALALKAGQSVEDVDGENADAFDVRKPRVPRLNAKNASLSDLFRWTPLIMAISAAGRTETAPTTIYCAPKWPEGKIGIMIDDVKDEIIEKCPPTAIVDTSDRSRQTFYVLNRKYPEQEFYNDFLKMLNAKYGDPKVTRQGWDTRLAGLYNRKKFMLDGSGRTPKCKLRSSSTRYPIEMERIIDEYRPIWEAEQKAKPQIEPEIIPVETASVSALELGGEKYGWESREAFRALLDEAYREAKGDAKLDTAGELLEEVPIPDYIRLTGQKCKEHLVAKWDRRNEAAMKEFAGFFYTDRSKIDADTARVLYFIGATPHEVYSYMRHHACQDEAWVMRENGRRQRVRSEAEKDRKARRTALNLAPESWFRHSWRSRPENWDEYNYDALVSYVTHVDAEYDRRMRILYPPRAPRQRQIPRRTPR